MYTPQDLLGFKLIFEDVLVKLKHLREMTKDLSVSDELSSGIDWEEMYFASEVIDSCRLKLSDVLDAFEDEFLEATTCVKLEVEYRDEVY